MKKLLSLLLLVSQAALAQVTISGYKADISPPIAVTITPPITVTVTPPVTVTVTTPVTGSGTTTGGGSTTAVATGGGSTTTTTGTGLAKLSGEIPYGQISYWSYVDDKSTQKTGQFFDGDLATSVSLGDGVMYARPEIRFPFPASMEVELDSVWFGDGKDTNPRSLTAADGPAAFWTERTGSFIRDTLGYFYGNNPVDGTWKKIKFSSPIRTDKFTIQWQYPIPTEIKFFGHYRAYTPVAYTKPVVAFDQMAGLNSYSWNFQSGSGGLDTAKITLAKTAKLYRYYFDRELGVTGSSYNAPNTFTFNPTTTGGWKTDEALLGLKNNGNDVIFCPKNGEITDSYLQLIRQLVIRYGANKNVPDSAVHMYTASSYPGNVVKKGLGYFNKIQLGNEANRTWKGLWSPTNLIGYITPAQMGAALVKQYNAIKEIDPTMMVITAGSCMNTPGYFQSLIEWCRRNNNGVIPFDAISYHDYVNEASDQAASGNPKGIAPEPGKFADRIALMKQVLSELIPEKYVAVYITETGYSIQDQFNTVKNAAGQNPKNAAQRIGTRSVVSTAADWVDRTMLAANWAGLDGMAFYQMYDDGSFRYNPNDYFAGWDLSCGFIEVSPVDPITYTRRRPAGYHMQTMRGKLGTYFVASKTLTGNVENYRYTKDGAADLNVYVMQTMNASTSVISIPSTVPLTQYTPADSSLAMKVTTLTPVNGFISLTVTETPTILTAYVGATGALVMPYDSILGRADTTRNRVDTTGMAHIYLDTDAKFKSFLTTAQTNKYAVVKDATYVGEYQQTGNWDNVYLRPETKYGAVFSRNDYSTNLIFTNAHSVKRVCIDGFKFKCGYVSNTLSNPMLWSNELVSFAGLEIRDCDLEGNPGGNFNAINLVQYSTASKSGATSTDVWYNRLNIHDIPRAGMEILCQKYDGGLPLLSNVIISNSTIQRTGLNNDYGAGLSFSGSMRNVFVFGNKLLENKFAGLEVVNAINLIARSNRIVSNSVIGAGVAISSDGNGGTENLFFDGDNYVDVRGRGFYVYQAKKAHFNSGYWKGVQRFDLKDAADCSFDNMTLVHAGIAGEYGWTWDGTTNGTKLRTSSLSSVGSSIPFTRPIQLNTGTYNNTIAGVTVIQSKNSAGTYNDGSVYDQGTNNSVSGITKTQVN